MCAKSRRWLILFGAVYAIITIAGIFAMRGESFIINSTGITHQFSDIINEFGIMGTMLFLVGTIWLSFWLIRSIRATFGKPQGLALILVVMGAMLMPDMAMAKVDTQAFADAATKIIADIGGSGGFLKAFRAICIVMGIILVAHGIRNMLKKEGTGGAIVQIFVGAIIFSVPEFINTFSITLFDQNSQSIVSDVSVAASNGGKLGAGARAFIAMSVLAIQIVGLLAVYRGLKTFADMALTHQPQPQQSRTAIIFIVAGVLCVNILWTLDMVASTLGPEAENTYNNIFNKNAL